MLRLIPDFPAGSRKLLLFTKLRIKTKIKINSVIRLDFKTICWSKRPLKFEAGLSTSESGSDVPENWEALMCWCLSEGGKEKLGAELKGNVDHRVTCLAAWQRAGKRYRLRRREVGRVGDCSRREVEGCSGPWPMSKWRCSVYCEEGSCQLCLLPSQQDGANPPPPSPRNTQTDRHQRAERVCTQEKSSGGIFPTLFGLRRGDGANGPPRQAPGADWQAFYWRFRVSLWSKIPVALQRRANAFLTRSWTDHLYHCEPPCPASRNPLQTSQNALQRKINLTVFSLAQRTAPNILLTLKTCQGHNSCSIHIDPGCGSGYKKSTFQTKETKKKTVKWD